MTVRCPEGHRSKDVAAIASSPVLNAGYSLMAIPSRKQVHRLLEQARKQAGVPGISVALGKGGQLITVSVGMASNSESMTDHARFEMSCLMKFFVSLVVLEYSLQGLIDLDAPIVALLPELAQRKQWEGISLRTLLSHTSGYRGLDVSDASVRWGMTWERFVAHLNSQQMLFTPGRVFNYEHTEHVIIGRILEKITGEPAMVSLTDRIFRPLEIEEGRTSTVKEGRAVANHVWDDRTAEYRSLKIPAFSPFWKTSLPDMTITAFEVARVMSALLHDTGMRRFASPFHADVLGLLENGIIDVPLGIRSANGAEALPVKFSAGCGIYANGYLGHNGSALGQTMGARCNPVTGSVIVVGVNAWSLLVRDRVLKELSGLLDEAQSAHPLTNAELEFGLSDIAPTSSPDRICGTYIGGYLKSVRVSRVKGDFVITAGSGARRGAELTIRDNGHGGYRLESHSPLSLRFSELNNGGDMALHLGVYGYRKLQDSVEPVTRHHHDGISNSNE